MPSYHSLGLPRLAQFLLAENAATVVPYNFCTVGADLVSALFVIRNAYLTLFFVFNTFRANTRFAPTNRPLFYTVRGFLTFSRFPLLLFLSFFLPLYLTIGRKKFILNVSMQRASCVCRRSRF